jgi:hypothetical protein
MTNTKGMDTKIKTPMQLLFYRIEQLRFANNPIDKIMEIKNEMLEIEKEQIQQAKEMEKERMRSYIEEKWKQYRIVTNEEDAWLFKKWLIKQIYGGNK